MKIVNGKLKDILQKITTAQRRYFQQNNCKTKKFNMG